MVKKRLSDLLRDEAQKPLDAEDKAVKITPDTPPAAIEIEVTAEVVTDEPSAEEAEPIDASKSTDTHARSPHQPTKAELQEQVTTLTAALHSAQEQVAELKEQETEFKEQETEFKHQITSLKADLKKQHSLVKQLQSELEQSAQVKAELEEAKQVILKLSAVNAKPAEPPAPSTPKAQPVALSRNPVAPAQPAALSRNPIAPAQPQRSLQVSRLPRMSSEIQPASYPKMSGESDTRLTDADIGWVD